MDKVRAILNDPEYQGYLQLIAEAETDRVYCKHDYHHALVVARLTYLLALEQKLETPFALKPLIYAAGVLHDIGRWVEYGGGEDHCSAGARLAKPLLLRAGFTTGETAFILAGIREHRQPGESQLGRLLARADDLGRDCYRCLASGTCYKREEMLRLHRSLEL